MDKSGLRRIPPILLKMTDLVLWCSVENNPGFVSEAVYSTGAILKGFYD